MMLTCTQDRNLLLNLRQQATNPKAANFVTCFLKDRHANYVRSLSQNQKRECTNFFHHGALPESVISLLMFRTP